MRTKRRLCLALAATLLAVAGATAAEEKELVVLNEAFCERFPSYDDERKARRKAGVKEGVRGEVSLRCDLNGDNDPRQCKVVSERPTGNGFAEAALELAKEYSCPAQNLRGRRRQIDLTSEFDRVMPDEDLRGRGGIDAFHLKPVLPPEAAKASVDGRALIQCDVTIRGLLNQCRIIAEAPANYGFGRAALLFAPGARVYPPKKDGKPIRDATVLPHSF